LITKSSGDQLAVEIEERWKHKLVAENQLDDYPVEEAVLSLEVGQNRWVYKQKFGLIGVA